MSTYKVYRKGEFEGEHPMPEAPVGPGDVPGGGLWVKEADLHPPASLSEEAIKRWFAEGHVEPWVLSEWEQEALCRDVVVQRRRRAAQRWDWLRYLGLMPRREGPKEVKLLPSGTVWGALWERARGRKHRTHTI